MKNTIVITALLVFVSGAFAQKSNDLYNEYSSYKGVTTLSFTKEMLDAVDAEFTWKDELQRVTGDIHQLRVMIVPETDASKEIRKGLRKQLNKHFEEIENEEAESNAYVYVHRKGKHVKEVNLLLLDEDDDSCILLTLLGDLTLVDPK